MSAEAEHVSEPAEGGRHQRGAPPQLHGAVARRRTPRSTRLPSPRHSVRDATARYLEGRLHGQAAQKPGRTPDMDAPAAAAMRAVLLEVGRAGS